MTETLRLVADFYTDALNIFDVPKLEKGCFFIRNKVRDQFQLEWIWFQVDQCLWNCLNECK